MVWIDSVHSGLVQTRQDRLLRLGTFLSLSLPFSLSLSFTQTHNKNITTGREECDSVYVEQDLYGSVSFDRSLSILYSRQMDEETHASTST